MVSKGGGEKQSQKLGSRMRKGGKVRQYFLYVRGGEWRRSKKGKRSWEKKGNQRKGVLIDFKTWGKGLDAEGKEETRGIVYHSKGKEKLHWRGVLSSPSPTFKRNIVSFSQRKKRREARGGRRITIGGGERVQLSFGRKNDGGNRGKKTVPREVERGKKAVSGKVFLLLFELASPLVQKRAKSLKKRNLFRLRKVGCAILSTEEEKKKTKWTLYQRSGGM